jgi:hypothetical protein
VGDNREKWGDFWKKLMVINQNIVLPPDPSEISMPNKNAKIHKML